MKKYFYTHLVEIESVFIELEKLELSEIEKKQLAHLIDSNLHHHILDAILSQLSMEDKKLFMDHLTKGDEKRIWQFLNAKTENIEEKIKKASEDIKEKLHKDIKEAKRVKA